MKKKILFFIALISALVCLLAISSSAAEYTYVDEDGKEYLKTTVDDSGIITEYSGIGFPMWNEQNEPLCWYLISETDTVKTVKSFVSTDPVYTNHGNNYFRFIQAQNFTLSATYPVPTKQNIVSINMPNDMGITAFSDYSAVGLYAQTGNYKPENTELLFARFPNTLSNSDRLVQATTVLEVSFDAGCKLKTLSNVAFYGCKSLRKVTLPDTLETINGGSGAFYQCVSLESIDLSNTIIVTIGENAFNGCSTLKEIAFPKTLKTLQTNAFAYTGFVELKIPDTVTSVGGRIAEGCPNLVKLVYSPNQSTLEQSSTYKSGNLQYIYLPKTITVANGTHHFTTQHANYKKSVFFFTGTETDANTFIALMRSKSNNERFNANSLVVCEWDSSMSDEDYVALANTNSMNYLVFNYNYCNAFYDGEHTNVDTKCETADVCGRACGYEVEAHAPTSVTVSYQKYNEAGKRIVTCDHEGCLGNGEFAIDPIFVTKGYSIKENNGYGIISTYVINDVALKEYEDLNGAITFGIIMANANFDGQSAFMSKNDQNKYVLNSSYGVQLEIKNRDYSKVNATIDQFTQDEASLNLVMALYVIEDDKVSYIQHEGTYAGEITKDATLDIVTITKIAEINGIQITLPEPALVPAGNDEE